MKLDLNNFLEVKKAETYLAKLIEKKAKIELIEKKQIRSISQNKYQHVLFQLFGGEFGYESGYVKDVIYKIEANQEIFKRTYTDKNGNDLLYWRSTADLTTEETTKAIERFRNYSSINGLYLPSSEEYIENSFYIDQEINKNQNFL